MSEYCASRHFDLVINLPILGSGAYRASEFHTPGYRGRRMAIDNGIPLITDIKCTKLFIEAMRQIRGEPKMRPLMDCLTNNRIVRLPGLIDVHVHMREPGAGHKETWQSGTRAALAGGLTLVLAMPNTDPPCTDQVVYEQIDRLASANACTDYALYLGATGDNVDKVAPLASRAAGLKMYLNQTFAALKLDKLADCIHHFEAFAKNRMIVCHAEEMMTLAMIGAAGAAGRAVHICHVSTADQLSVIIKAKERGLAVTCEVAPHHLFLTKDSLDPRLSAVRPPLASQTDIDFLWKNLAFIDCFATDHAPHTVEEKMTEGGGVPGFPGLEYMLPLMLTAVDQGKLTLDELIDRLCYNPRRIFQLPEQPDTYVEVDMGEEWTVPMDGGFSKAKWTPYGGCVLKGRVRRVVLRGQDAFIDGEILVEPGFGRNVREGALQSVATLNRPITDNFASVMEELKQNRPLKPSSPPRSRSPVANLKHILQIEDFSKLMMNEIFELADKYRENVDNNVSHNSILQGYILGSMFYEVSTRTSCSFTTAMYKLGGNVNHMNATSSSVQKGESLQDSVKMMATYSDVVLLRHPEVGAAKIASAVCKKALINAGDGTGEHPTQAMLDVYTIREEFGTVNNLTIALVGDLKNGRTVHSLAKALCLYTGIKLRYVSPTESLQMPADIIDYVQNKAGFSQELFTNLEQGIRSADVVYVTRIQKERFTDSAEYDRIKDIFVVTPKLLNQAERRDDFHSVIGRRLPIVMHPLPRLSEISTELDEDGRAAYFRQAANAVYVRMALLTIILGKN